MLENLPIYVAAVFGLTTILTLLMLMWVVRNSSSATTRRAWGFILAVLIVWLATQGVLGYFNFYNRDLNSIPPTIMLTGILPMILLIILLFMTRGGRRFIDSLPLRLLTVLHVIRIPVELVLFWLAVQKAVPFLMTFEGRNLDILSGLSSPFIAWFGFVKNRLSRKAILIWNLICLGLLFNIVVTALLAAPFPFQQLAFDQPNIAILYFPFVWLPAFVVPVVLFSHLAAIRQLLRPQPAL